MAAPLRGPWRGYCDDAGNWALDRPAQFARWMAEKFSGKEFVLSVRAQDRQRSYQQLRYWFGVPMKLLSEHTGYTKMQMHYLAVAVCFGVLEDPKTGLVVPVVPASRYLSTKQFSDLIEWCPPWAMETYDVSVPLPNEVDLSELPGVDDEE